MSPRALEEIFDSIFRVAEALGKTHLAEIIVADARSRINAVRARAHEEKRRPTVACIEWLDPLMASGNWVPEMVEMAGGQPLFGETGKPSPWLSWAELVVADPEVIVIKPCGLDLGRACAETEILTQRAEYASLQAITSGRVAVVDGNFYFNRPGPRIVDSLEMLAEMLHPEVFDFGYRDRTWLWYGRA